MFGSFGRLGDPGNELAGESRAAALPYELEPATSGGSRESRVVSAFFFAGENIESELPSRKLAALVETARAAASGAASAACSASVSATAAIKPDGSSARASASRTAATSKDRDVGNAAFGSFRTRSEASERVPVREPFAEKKTNALAVASHANARVISQSARSSPRGKASEASEEPGFAKATARAKAARAASDTSFTGKPSSNASASATSAAATRAPSRAEAWSPWFLAPLSD